MRWRRCDRGQTTIEWLGVSAVVVGTIVAVTALAPGLGDTVRDTVVRLICEATGGDCADALDEQVCITQIAARRAEAEVTAFSIGGDLTVGTQTFVKSDGTAEVRVSAEGALGGEFIAGLSGEVGNLEAETPNANVEVEGAGNASVVFDFPDQASADDFVDDLTATAAGTAAGSLLGPLGSLAGGGLAAWIRDLDVPSPSSVQYIGSIAAEASGSGTFIEGGGGSNVAAGVSYDLESGHTTLIFELGARAGAEFQPLADAAGVEISSTTQARLEVDGSGNPVGLELRNILTGEVSGFITGTAAQAAIGDEPLAQEVATALIGLDPAATGQIRTSATVDLTDPDIAAAAGDVIDALLDGDVGSATEAAVTLGGEVYEDGQVTADVYVGQEEALTVVDLEAGEGIGFELELGGSASEANLVASYIAQPSTGVDQRCDG